MSRILARLALFALVSTGCATQAASGALPGSIEAPSSGIAQRWSVSQEHEVVARWLGSECWVSGRVGVTDSVVALRYPETVCRETRVPRWLDALDLRTGGAGNFGTHVYVPVDFLPPRDALLLARRFLERDARLRPERFSGDELRDARWRLELYSKAGALEPERFSELCAAGNAIACISQADPAAWVAHAERACALGLERACADIAYRRLLALRDTAARLAAVTKYHDAFCEMCPGARSELARICGHRDSLLFDFTCQEPHAAAPSAGDDLRGGARPPVVATGDDPKAAELAAIQRRALAEVRATKDFAALLSLFCQHGGLNGGLAWRTLGHHRALFLDGLECRGVAVDRD